MTQLPSGAGVWAFIASAHAAVPVKGCRTCPCSDVGRAMITPWLRVWACTHPECPHEWGCEAKRIPAGLGDGAPDWCPLLDHPIIAVRV